jgi:DNA-binding MarR family transcriptional regulator
MAAAGASLTVPQALVLVAALDAPDSQRAIVDEIGIDRSTLATIAHALMRRGLITLRRDPADARRKPPKLTPEGVRCAAIASRVLATTGERT